MSVVEVKLRRFTRKASESSSATPRTDNESFGLALHQGVVTSGRAGVTEESRQRLRFTVLTEFRRSWVYFYTNEFRREFEDRRTFRTLYLLHVVVADH